MANLESGRFESQKYIVRKVANTVARGITIGTLLLTAGCELKSENRVAPKPTSEIKLNLPESKLQPHCIEPYPNPILDHANFFCDANGKPKSNLVGDATPLPVIPSSESVESGTTS